MHDPRPSDTTRREVLAFAAFPWFGNLFGPRHHEIAGIRFRYVRHGSDRRHYIQIHGNERTAAEVLRDHMKHNDGRAFLVDNTIRNVRLKDGEIDPNRMWSRDGAEKNLVSLNTGWDFYRVQDALDELDRDRQEFLDKLLPQRGELLVALHNNGPGYSVTDEVPISDQTSLKAQGREHEFMLCTDPRDYEKLQATSFNVVLQKDAPKTDDGSLSRLAAARHVRYVNIESPHGGADAQRAMLDAVESLPERY